MNLPWKTCKDFNILQCKSCEQINGTGGYVQGLICWVEWYRDQIEKNMMIHNISIKETLLEFASDKNIRSYHDFFYFEKAIEQYYPKYSKIMNLLVLI